MYYDVKLVGFNTDEIIMIDLCMKVLGYDASEAYECIDNMPSVIMSNVEMNKVKEIKAAFESEGAIIEVTPVKNEEKKKNHTSSKSAQEEKISRGNTLNESDLELLNLKFNPYENSKSSDELIGNTYSNSPYDSVSQQPKTVNMNGRTSDNGRNVSNNINSMKEKRTRKYGRRSTDIDPKSVNYGRRSTDSNPMIYSEQTDVKSSFNKSNYKQQSYNDINYNNRDIKLTYPSANTNVSCNEMLSPDKAYDDDMKRIKSIAPLDEMYTSDDNMSAYEDLSNEEAILSDVGNTIIERNSNRKSNDVEKGNPYGSNGRKDGQAVYGGRNNPYDGLKQDNTSTGYGSLRKDSSHTGYGSLRKDSSHTGYGSLRKDNSHTGYGSLREDGSHTGYGNFRKDNSHTGYGSLRKDNSYTGYGSLRDDESRTAYGSVRNNIKSSYRDINNGENESLVARDVSEGKSPYSDRLSKSRLYSVSELNKTGMSNVNVPTGFGNYEEIMEHSINKKYKADKNNKINEIDKKNNISKSNDNTSNTEGQNPYENSVMNFTKQQHFGTIDKEKDVDDLYDLSAIRRDKNGSKKALKKYQKDQLTCPKCGSAFVSTRRGQGFFGTAKVKYVCEACKYRF